MSDLISRQAAISAICNACGKIDCDKMDKCEKLKLPPANTSEIPNSSDLISRRAAIDAVNDVLAEYIPTFRPWQDGIPLRCASKITALPPAPAIPLEWIDSYIKTCNLFDLRANVTAEKIIKTMVKIWEQENPRGKRGGDAG